MNVVWLSNLKKKEDLNTIEEMCAQCLKIIHVES